MISIRPARHTDGKAILAIRNACRSSFVFNQPITEAQQKTFMKEKVTTGLYKMWVICNDMNGKNIVGYTQARNFEGNSCEVGIAIDPAYRRKKFADAGMYSLKFNLKMLGMRTLWLEVYQANKGAIALFEKAHYKEVSRRATPIGDLIRMERNA